MTPKKILVVEDSPALAESLQDLFTLQGYTALLAPNGKTGLELALAEHPDLILLDLKLPDIDGYEVLRQIRKDSWGKKATVLILTASDLSETIPEDLNLTENDIMRKTNYGLDEILARVYATLFKD